MGLNKQNNNSARDPSIFFPYHRIWCGRDSARGNDSPVLIWKRNFFCTDTASVHTYPMKTGLSEDALQSGTFWKSCFCENVWTDENGGFRIRWCNTSFTTIITHALWKMLSFFHCLAFLFGRAKTIRIRYVWTRVGLKTEEESLRFETKTDTCGRGLRLTNIK